MSTSEAEVRLGIGRDRLFRVVAEEGLPVYRIGHRFRFKRVDIDAYLERARERGQVDAAALEPRKYDVERRAARYDPDRVYDRREVKAMRARLAAFFAASRDLAPAPCPLCDEVVAQPDMATHFVGHRVREVGSFRGRH